jgi:hypothetical protein
MRRLTVVLVGVALVAGAALVPMLPAGAAYSLNVDGFATCNPVTGQYDVTWNASSDAPGDVTINSAVMTPPGTDIVASFSPNPVGPSVVAHAFVTLPGTTSASVSVGGTSTIGPFTSSSVLLAGTCTATAALTVGPNVAVPGEAVTISGTGCVLTGLLDSVAQATVPGSVTGTVGFTPPLAFGPITAAADGSWSTSVVVPAGTPPGSYPVNATCTLPAPMEVSAQADASFQYARGSITVPALGPINFTG